jgi:hypothetical protein
MTIQTIFIGNVANDGLGDDLRSAFQKVNANFTDLSNSLTVTASNIGTTGAGVFKEKVGADLQFKKLVAGTKMFLDERTDSIIFNNQQPDSFVRIDTNNGIVLGDDFINITLGGAGGAKNIYTSVVDSVISIDTVAPVTDLLTDYDFGTIDGVFEYSIQQVIANSNIDFGTIPNPGRFTIDLGTL